MVDLWSEPKKCRGYFQSTPEKKLKQRTELKTLYFLKGKEVDFTQRKFAYMIKLS